MTDQPPLEQTSAGDPNWIAAQPLIAARREWSQTHGQCHAVLHQALMGLTLAHHALSEWVATIEDERGTPGEGAIPDTEIPWPDVAALVYTRHAKTALNGFLCGRFTEREDHLVNVLKGSDEMRDKYQTADFPAQRTNVD